MEGAAQDGLLAALNAISSYRGQDFTTEEIAQMLEINEGTVRSRLHTARERLKAALRGALGGPWSD